MQKCFRYRISTLISLQRRSNLYTATIRKSKQLLHFHLSSENKIRNSFLSSSILIIYYYTKRLLRNHKTITIITHCKSVFTLWHWHTHTHIHSQHKVSIVTPTPLSSSTLNVHQQATDGDSSTTKLAETTVNNNTSFALNTESLTKTFGTLKLETIDR